MLSVTSNAQPPPPVAITVGVPAAGAEQPFTPPPPPQPVPRAGAEPYPDALAARRVRFAASGPDGLTQEERALVAQLSARDREVRKHEEAHARVGGPFAGAPSYDFQAGPDGRRYAIGGEVPIDVSPVQGDPSATIFKMEVVKAAALAPAEPSAQDRSIAATADAIRLEAIAELNRQRRDVREAAPTRPGGPIAAAGEAFGRMARMLSGFGIPVPGLVLDRAA